jgi:hypothetical protein
MGAGPEQALTAVSPAVRRSWRDIPDDRDSLRDSLLVTAPDGYDHLVSERVFATSRDGRFLARCGATIVSASMCDNPQTLCPLCVPHLPGNAYAEAEHARLPWELTRGLRLRHSPLLDDLSVGVVACPPRARCGGPLQGVPLADAGR